MASDTRYDAFGTMFARPDYITEIPAQYAEDVMAQLDSMTFSDLTGKSFYHIEHIVGKADYAYVIWNNAFVLSEQEKSERQYFIRGYVACAVYRDTGTRTL